MSLHNKNVEALIGNFSQSTLDRSEERNEAPYNNLFEDIEGDMIEPQIVDDFGNPITIPEVNISPSDEVFMENDDHMIGLKIPVERGGEVLEGTIKSRKRNADGSLVGTANTNLSLDSHVYEVEFSDGSYNEYATNVLV